VAFVPLLLVEDEIAKRKSRRAKKDRKGSVTGYALITFVFFVILTTWWVYFATWTGIVASVIVNGGYMTLTFLVFHRVRRKLGDRLGYASFVVFCLAFEFLYIRAQVNFPWIVLGNGFANDVALIQWYEWTGALGGSLWVLVMNVLIFKLVKAWQAKKSSSIKLTFAANRLRVGWVLAVLLGPILFSFIRFLSYEEKDDPYEMVVLQPNIVPFE